MVHRGMGMKAVLGVGVFVLVLSLCWMAEARGGLIGYWPFDGTGADLSGDGTRSWLATLGLRTAFSASRLTCTTKAPSFFRRTAGR